MQKKILSMAIALATVTGSLAATPAAARHGRHGGYYEDHDRSYYGRNRGRSYGCDRGTGGTIIGGVVGGLAGHEVAGRRNRTEGVIIGAAVGALAGRAIDKSSGRRCR